MALLKLPFRQFADNAALLMGLGLAVGRVGCMLVGCCFGRITDLPWGTAFSAGSEAYWNHFGRGLLAADTDISLPVHPLQLYLVFAECLVTVALFWLRRHRAYLGEIGVALVALQGLSMAVLECVRETEGLAPVPLRQIGPLVVGAVAATAFAVVRWTHSKKNRPIRVQLGPDQVRGATA